MMIFCKMNGLNAWVDNYSRIACRRCHHHWLSDINYLTDNVYVALWLFTIRGIIDLYAKLDYIVDRFVLDLCYFTLNGESGIVFYKSNHAQRYHGRSWVSPFISKNQLSSW